MLRTLLLLSHCDRVIVLRVAQEPSKRAFRAITVNLMRFAACSSPRRGNGNTTFEVETDPVSYVEELGLIHLTGNEHKDAITIDDLLKSKKLDGIDLSYIDLKTTNYYESQKPIVRHLY